MAALTVAGTSLPVAEFTEGVPRQRGAVTPAFNNTLRSSVISEKRQFTVVTAPVDNTYWTAMKSALADGADVTVTGDLILGASLTMKGTVAAQLVGTGQNVSGYPFVYVLTISLQES